MNKESLYSSIAIIIGVISTILVTLWIKSVCGYVTLITYMFALFIGSSMSVCTLLLFDELEKGRDNIDN